MLFDLYIPQFHVKFFDLFYFKYSGKKKKKKNRFNFIIAKMVCITQQYLFNQQYLLNQVFSTIRNGRAVDFITMSVFILQRPFKFVGELFHLVQMLQMINNR